MEAGDPDRDEGSKTRAFLNSVAFDLDPDLQVSDPVIALALAEWHRLRGDRPMPSPGDIDPLDLPRHLLPHILLLDVEHVPVRRFRWRLIGTHTTAALGRDATGRYWDELYTGRALAAMLLGPQWVLEHRRPVRVLGTAVYGDRGKVRSESIDLPLSRDGTAVDRVLIASIYRMD